ncbi:MAG: STAS domain-containing protein [Desulfobacterales bacterium]|nr:STAS domain-containing protein [Desulfobacterales bacterium]
MVTSIQKIGGKTIVKVHEDIADMRTGEAFKSTLMELYKNGEKEIIIDFSETRFINSHGIGKILMFYKRLKEVGGNILVTTLPPSIKDTFETLMLDKLIPEVKLLNV